jgi:O-antigen/teichoic acid export membrane protein
MAIPVTEVSSRHGATAPVTGTEVHRLVRWACPALSQRAALALRGSFWTLAGYGSSQVLRLLSVLILAKHFLGPEAFGLAALVTSFLAGLDMLSDLGVGMDVVQHPRGDDPAFVSTAFWMQAARMGMLSMLAAALSYPFAAFYHQPALRWLAVVGALSVGVRGLSSGAVWSMTRHVDLKKVTLLNIAGDSVGFVAAVTWAAVSPTAWALVIGKAASAVTYSVTSHVIGKPKMSFAWDSNAAKDIMRFGLGILVSTSTYFVATEAERLVVGKVVSLVEFGCFTLAISLALPVPRALQQVLSQVFYPMISRSYRNSPCRANEDYVRALWLVVVTSSLLAVAFILLSKPLVVVLLGPKYSMTGWMLQLLGFRASLELLLGLAAMMLFAVGTSKYAAVGNVFRLMFLAAGLSVAFARFGLREAIWVLAASPIFGYIPLLWGLRARSSSALRAELIGVATFAAVSGLAVLASHILQH